MLNTINIQTFTPEIPYEKVLSKQEDKVAELINHTAPETLFIGEHAPIYTCGTSAQVERDVLGTHKDIPVIPTGRGGEVTYHGPGQLIAYPIFDLRVRGKDLRAYIDFLQEAMIRTLKEFDIDAYTTDDVGVWVKTASGEKKIGAIGVRVRKWVTFHGLSLNVDPNLEHFNGIIPCGITTKGVTSIAALSKEPPSMEAVQKMLIQNLTQ